MKIKSCEMSASQRNIMAMKAAAQRENGVSVAMKIMCGNIIS